jgi:GNAT superfamily N-acetyltransferase
VGDGVTFEAVARARSNANSDGLRIRRAVESDLEACERIWRESINDYTRRLNQLDIPSDNPGLRRLHQHALATDGERFLVAEREARVVGFGSAVLRPPLWFLSMLFVDPVEQARGLGRRILVEILPDPDQASILATATDSAQPISNGLYSSFGVIPRVPMLHLAGRPADRWQPPSLPDGVIAMALPDTPAAQAQIDTLDLEVAGFAHPQDHAFALRERPSRFGYRDASGKLVGYGYTSEVGRVAPIAALDEALAGAILGHLLMAVAPRGASAIWVPGSAGAVLTTALSAGLRIEDFPLLLCWTERFADFSRYIPISPGLL